ncbi:MAG: gamma-glutamyltransferase [Chloroflexia bacterium]
MAESKGLPLPEQGPKAVARAGRAMVSTSHPAVTQAALGVLRDGGNAVDAMLTAMVLQQVLEPQMSTIAGGFAMLYWEAKSGRAYYLNAELDHPTGGTIPNRDITETSGQRIGVPGTVVGMRAAAERFGTRPWESYFGPAIAAAEEGFPMYSFLYGEMSVASGRLSHYPSGRERYTPDGYLPRVGQIWQQPKLAATLRRIAHPDGAEWFQAGEFAERFAAAVRDSGGALTVEDMRNYAVRWDEPTPFRFRGHEFLGSPPPDTGGPYVAFCLGILEQCDLAGLGDWRTSPRALALIARVLALADDHIGRYCVDPAAFDSPLDTILSPEYLALQASILQGSFPKVDLSSPKQDGQMVTGVPNDPNKTDSNQIVIADEQGNWLTMLHTVYGSPFGTGLVVDGVGTNTGNGFPGVAVGPGRRIVAPLTSILGLRNGKPWLALGTPSYPPPYITLAMLNLLAYDMTLQEAIEAPRFRFDPDAKGPRPAWAIGRLTLETRLPQETLDGLGRLGIAVNPLGDFNWHVGSVQAVQRDGDGQLSGVADSRRGGYAAGY